MLGRGFVFFVGSVSQHEWSAPARASQQSGKNRHVSWLLSKLRSPMLPLHNLRGRFLAPSGRCVETHWPAQKLLMASKCRGVNPELLGVLFKAHLGPGSSSRFPGPCPSAHMLCLSCCALSCHETPSLAAQGSTPTPLLSRDVFLAVLLLMLMQRKNESNKCIVGERKEKRLCPRPSWWRKVSAVG